MLRLFVVSAATAAGTLLASATRLQSQDVLPTGRIVGRIVDARTGNGLTDVGVQVVGTTMGVVSGIDGTFTLAAVRAGTITLQARRIGYTPKTVTGIILPAGGSIEQRIALDPVSTQLQAQVVTASAERGTVSEALDQQRTATGIVSTVTSEQISRSPDADAAQAVQRVSGVTVQDGRNVFVRGLGERYTTVSLNGARIPSPEPEKRMVPLDMFPAGLLQAITTAKTFTPDLPGDFSGAAVDIQTREFPLRRVTLYSAGVGMNTRVTGRRMLEAPTVGREWLGFAGSARQLPAAVRAAGDFSRVSGRSQTNELIGSFRNVWSPAVRSGGLNQSYGYSTGGQDAVLGRTFGYLASATYSRSEEVAANQVYALTRTSTGGQAEVLDRYQGETGRTSMLLGGMLNLSTMIGRNSRVSLNTSSTRSADNEARQDFGFNENLSFNLQRTQLRFVERSVWSSQLRGEHQLSDRQHLDWSVTGSGVTRDEPDRSDILYGQKSAGTPLFFVRGYEGARRTFGSLRERGITSSLAYRLNLGAADVKLGGMQRMTDRTAHSEQYTIAADVNAEATLPPERLIAAIAAGAGRNAMVGPVGSGGSYTASDRQLAGFAMLEYPLGTWLRMVGGARVENAQLRVQTETVFGTLAPAWLATLDVLPALALNFHPGENSNLRFSASQTLSRPEYRELSPFTFRDVLGGQNVYGNPALRRTLVQNYDARWEWYPGSTEVISVATFAKRFSNPIERVEKIASNNALFTYENAQRALSYGFEGEAQVKLDRLAERLSSLSTFVNGTVMTSAITLGNAQGGSTNARRTMVGQAPYVLNAGLMYLSTSGSTSLTGLFNRVGRRIVAAGTLPLPDTYEEARNVLDVSARFPLVGALSGRLDARNLLDTPYRQTQGAVTREQYRSGRVLQMGVTWRP